MWSEKSATFTKLASNIRRIILIELEDYINKQPSIGGGSKSNSLKSKRRRRN
jgi:hypothetical protein